MASGTPVPEDEPRRSETRADPVLDTYHRTVDDLEGDAYFTVTVDADASPAVVTAAGELDAASSREFASALDEALACGTGVALDLGQVTFVDSAGLRVMAVALRRAKEENLTLGVSAMSDAVRRIFDMTGVSALLAPQVRPPPPTWSPDDARRSRMVNRGAGRAGSMRRCSAGAKMSRRLMTRRVESEGGRCSMFRPVGLA